MNEHRIKDLRINFSVLVCSSTRTKDNDTSGTEIISLLEKAGHNIAFYEVIPDDPELIRKTTLRGIEAGDALIISGGTGITSHDVTVEAVREIADKEIRGFGITFTILSYQQIGTSAMMSGSTAFLVRKKPVFCLPGSPSGASLGVSGIILKEIDHIIHEAGR